MSFDQGHALLIGVGSHQYETRLDVPITVTDAQRSSRYSARREILWLSPGSCWRAA